MARSTTYYGWRGNGDFTSAYATWRIAADIQDDPGLDLASAFPQRPSVAELAKFLLNHEFDRVRHSGCDQYVADRAESFLGLPNYSEIAEYLLVHWEER